MNATGLSGFLTEALDAKDSAIITESLNIVSDLYVKMKDFVQESFVREGVINRVSKLVSEKIPNPVRLNRYVPRLPPDL